MHFLRGLGSDREPSEHEDNTKFLSGSLAPSKARGGKFTLTIFLHTLVGDHPGERVGLTLLCPHRPFAGS